MVYVGKWQGYMIPLSPGTTILGREIDNDTVLDEGPVSGQHAAIAEAEEGHLPRGLGSATPERRVPCEPTPSSGAASARAEVEGCCWTGSGCAPRRGPTGSPC